VQYSEQTPTPKDLPNFEAVKATLAKLKVTGDNLRKQVCSGHLKSGLIFC